MTTLTDVELRSRSGRAELVGHVEREGVPAFELYFSVPESHGAMLTESADPFLAALLVPSMLHGGAPLKIVPPVSTRLAQGIDRIQAILAKWYPGWRRPELRITMRAEPTVSRGTGVGTFFSGGIDSFFTAIKRRSELTHLVYMRGIETPLTDLHKVAAAEQRIVRIGGELGTPVLVGETNIRTHFPLEWGKYHGAGLAATALALQGGFNKIFVPSTFAYDEIIPWGSSPLLDEHYSSEHVEIVHDGAEATRAEKTVSLIAENPVALANLRVCVWNSGGDVNCGRCFKCVRTMAALAAAGVLENTPAFSTESKKNERAWWKGFRADGIPYNEANLAMLDRTGRAPRTRALLAGVLRSQKRRVAWRSLFENSTLRHALPLLRFGWIKEVRRQIKNR